MSVAARTFTVVERRQLDRSHAARELVSTIAAGADLPLDAEMDLRVALWRRLDPILEAADDVVAAKAELDALDRRLDAHARTHRPCAQGLTCWTYGELQKRRARLQARSDRAVIRLLGGRR